MQIKNKEEALSYMKEHYLYIEFIESIIGKKREKQRLKSNILVFPSYNEVYSRVILEAIDKGEQS